MTDLNDPAVLYRIMNQVLWTHHANLSNLVVEGCRRQVISGPFTGMMLPERKSWGCGDIASKALGCYEAELHGWVERAIERQPKLILNVGCAEGYYAVGLARRLPQARVYAFDISEEGRAVCALAAQQNGVADRVIIEGACTGARILDLVQDAGRVLIVMDCEGAELDLLNRTVVNGLVRTDVIVECHDNASRTITPLLAQLFSDAGHEIEIVREGPRDPAGIPLLQSLSAFDRWLMVCEFRGEVQHWLAGWAHNI